MKKQHVFPLHNENFIYVIVYMLMYIFNIQTAPLIY